MIKQIAFKDTKGYPMSLAVDIPEDKPQMLKVKRLHDDVEMEIDMSRVTSITEPKIDIKPKEETK